MFITFLWKKRKNCKKDQMSVLEITKNALIINFYEFYFYLIKFLYNFDDFRQIHSQITEAFFLSSNCTRRFHTFLKVMEFTTVYDRKLFYFCRVFFVFFAIFSLNLFIFSSYFPNIRLQIFFFALFHKNESWKVLYGIYVVTVGEKSCILA